MIWSQIDIRLNIDRVKVVPIKLFEILSVWIKHGVLDFIAP
jgi:hypothetical protein